MNNMDKGIFAEWIDIISSTLSRSEKLFIVGFFIIFLYFLIKGSTKERVFFIFQPLICFVFVLNPFATQLFYNIIGAPFSGRLYRFFWALPIYFAYAYFFTKTIISCHNHKTDKKFIYIVSIILFLVGVNQITAGALHTFGSKEDSLTPVQNIYKINNNILEISNIIEENKKNPKSTANVVSDFTVDMELRAYDASLLKLDISDCFDIYLYEYSESNAEYLKQVLEERECNYIIIPSANNNIGLLQNIGCSLIGQTSDNSYIVLAFR